MMFGLVTDMLAPTNTLWGNPAALKRTLETGGRNLVTGRSRCSRTGATTAGLPASVDRDSFDVGETLALTPGDVVTAASCWS
jgi:polyhydroxyalkanoate synthase